MKSLNKTKIDLRFDRSNIKPVFEVQDVKYKLSSSSATFDKMLYVVIPGNPIADGRVRFSTNAIYNPNKANLMKVFDRIFHGSGLENLIIFGPIYFDITVYLKIPQVIKKQLDNKSKELLKQEKLIAMSKPDNDNFEKICFDLLQDKHYMIVFGDESIIENTTRKYYTDSADNTRVEMRVYFKSKQDKWYMEKVKDQKDYLRYLLSPKYMKNNVKVEDWKKHFYFTVFEWYKNKKSSTSVLTTVNSILKVYKTEEIYLISEGRNVNDALDNVIRNVERICV